MMKTTNWNLWARSSSTWMTSIPVDTASYPSRNCSAESIVHRWILRAELPEPIYIECHQHSKIGSGLCKDYSPYQEKFYNMYLTHVTIKWPCEIEGPILIGAGIHFGLGILQPFDDDLK